MQHNLYHSIKTEIKSLHLPSAHFILNFVTKICAYDSAGSTSEGRPQDTDTSPSSSPQESPNTFINGRSTESLSSLVSDDPRPPPRKVSTLLFLHVGVYCENFLNNQNGIQ